MANRTATQAKILKQCEQFVLNAFKNLEDEPQKLKAFKTLFLRYKKMNNNVLESQMRLVDLIQDYPELVRKLNQLVPDEFKVQELDFPDNQLQDEDEEMDINTIFAELNKRKPQKVQDLINLITLIKENKNKQDENNYEMYRERISSILQDEPKLYRAFIKFIGPALEPPEGDMEEEFEAAKGQAGGLDSAADADSKKKARPTKPVRFDKINATKRTQVQRVVRKKEGETSIMQVSTISVREPAEPALPQTLRNEMYLFEYLEKNLSPETYLELTKIIYLYAECIITPNEVFKMAKPIFEGNENYFSFFQEIIHIREPIRRKNTLLFKPLNDVDFKKLNCDRQGSYTRIPEYFPYAKNPFNSKNVLYKDILNRTWVSVPSGSETNFTVGARNTYEVNMFISEDEKYEFDIAIYCYQMAVKWLNSFDESTTDEKKAQLAEKILRLRVIQKIYGNNSEIVELFRKNPVVVSKVVLERVQAKVQEIRDTKENQARKKWQDIAAQNFHRSLDHRSFYFKQSEKKITSHKHFIPEAQARHKELNVIGNLDRADKYWTILDTFHGLANGETCKYQDVQRDSLIDKQSSVKTHSKIQPIYQMNFADKQIEQDIFDILCVKIQNFHATLTEKDKIVRYLRIFMTEILSLPCKAENSFDSAFDQTALFKSILKIESKIFTKTFNYDITKTNTNGTNNANNNNEASALTPTPAANNEGATVEKEKEKEKTKKDGMEVEQSETKNKKNQKNANGKTEEEKGELSDDEIKLDSGSEENTNVKEMEYTDKYGQANGLYAPAAKEGQRVFYGTQHVYCLIRYYFTLYERFVKAREIAHQFEDNIKTKALSSDEKENLAKERYENFKIILAHLVKSNLDNEKYEDLLRGLFGNQAYLLFYTDKIIHSIIITLQKVYGDDITLKTLNLFTESELMTRNQDPNKSKNSAQKSKNWSEYVYLSQLNRLTLKYINNIQNTTFFRFLYDPEKQLVAISLHDWPYKEWKDKTLESVAEYTQEHLITKTEGNCLESSQNLVFLDRNREMNKDNLTAENIKVIQRQNIEWKYLPNTQKLVTDKPHQEESLFVLRNKKDEGEKSKNKQIKSQITKFLRFKILTLLPKEWQKKTLKV